MDTYILSLAMIGLVGLSMSWLPSIARKMSISYSILYLGFGLLAYSIIPDLPWASPYREEGYTTHLTELIVIIALMSTGLRIERKVGLKLWSLPVRLVTALMFFSIFVLSALGYWYLGLSAASALLLGAVMAPTDPVLADDVQVGPPNEPESEREEDIKFALTAEAGMNDGMAFPFTWLAIAVAAASQSGESWFWSWLSWDVFYRIGAGLVSGYLFGLAIAYLFFTLPERKKMTGVRDGLVALSTTLLVYGATELIHGYGFIAVFVAAVTIRNYDKDHKYHRKLHEFIDQIERILLGVLLLLFGGSLVAGILEPLTWPMALVGLAFVFLVRPIGGLISLIGTPLDFKEKIIISFFGIKGIGSFYYLAFALGKENFPDEPKLWALAAFIVLVSILVHGLTAIPIMKTRKT